MYMCVCVCMCVCSVHDILQNLNCEKDIIDHIFYIKTFFGILYHIYSKNIYRLFLGVYISMYRTYPAEICTAFIR